MTASPHCFLPRSTLLAIPLAAVLGLSPASAQTPPDAGALRQQIERDLIPSLPRPALPEKPARPEPFKAPTGSTVVVTTFRFAGNTLLSEQQLAPAVAAFLNRTLSLDELQQAAAAVAQLYRDAGWIVHAYLPKQDITDGVVAIQIVEAVFAGAVLEGPSPTLVPIDAIFGRFDRQLGKGELLNAEAIDRGLLLADDLPGVAVVGALRPGLGENETELVLKASDELRIVGDLGVDNNGARSTGQTRLVANFYINSPLGFGDLLSGNLIHAEGNEYQRIAYTLPVGNDGWRIGANASHMTYSVVTSEFASLESQGMSDSVGLEASYPIIRSRLKNLYLLLNVDRKTYENEAAGAVQSDYKVDALSVGLAGNLFDSFAGGGANSYSLSWASGHLNQGDLDFGENPSLAGGFSKWRYALSRQQVITDTHSLFAAFSGQVASKALDSSEKLFLGGANGVRAYPSNEAGGSSGQLANIELRWRLPQSLVLTGFYDWGRVENPGLPSFILKGAGLSLAWQTPIGPSLKATWAHRIGDNPNPTATGTDQDGTLVQNRWWLNALIPF